MKLAILGATGSIGRSALDLVKTFPDRLEITALTCARNVESLAAAIAEHRPRLAAVLTPEDRRRLNSLLNDKGLRERPEIVCGPAGYAQAAAEVEADMVLSAMVGLAGLAPTLAAVARGRRVALANKEALVAGGELLMPLAARTGAEILPVDSEHSAVFQLWGGLAPPPGLRRLILTASGGPFRGLGPEDLELVSRDEALAHPRWSMGPKISCDSATLMNKGLELIEAHHLFGLPYEALDILIHPQSAIHALVEFIDGTQTAVLGPADMRTAVAYAFSHPDRWPLLPGLTGPGLTGPGLTGHGLAGLAPLNLAALPWGAKRGLLTFEEPDYETFWALRLAAEAGRSGGGAPVILSSANEEAVELFLAGAIGFADIPRLVQRALSAIPSRPLTCLDDILALDEETRRLTRSLSPNPRL